MGRSNKYYYDAISLRPLVRWLRVKYNVQTPIYIRTRRTVTFFGQWYIKSGAYYIQVSPDETRENIIRTTLHEFRHIYQHYKNWYTEIPNNKILWRGKRYQSYVYTDPLYKQQPWELDAVHFEKRWKIYERFVI